MGRAVVMVDLNKQRRARNLALGGVLLALVVLFYLITIVRMEGQ